MKTFEVFVKSDIWTLLPAVSVAYFSPFCLGYIQRNFPVSLHVS